LLFELCFGLNLGRNFRKDLREFSDQLFLVLSYGGAILGIFIVLLLNNKRVRKSRANVFLSVLLIAFSFSILHIRYAGRVINHFSIKVYDLGDPTFFLIAPLLWFYTLELTGSRVSFSLKTVFHFLPFILIVIGSLTLNAINPDNHLVVFLRHHDRVPIILFWFVVVAQFTFYQIIIQRRWTAYQQIMKEEVSNTEDVNISWVKFFMTVFLLINIFFFFSLFVVIHMQYTMWLWKAVAVLFSLSVFALGYKGILQKEIFYPGLTGIPKTAETTIVKTRPDQSLMDAVNKYMIDKKPYLDSELTLSQLAKDLNMSRSQLSHVINDGIGDNFYNFINKYRVEQVKKFMTDPAVKNYSLLGIALEAGFKSKSSFNLIFKRFTGLTPTEYKKNIST